MSDAPRPTLLDIYLVPAELLVPRDEYIPNGTTYFPVQMDRPGFIVARDAVAAGTIYVYPGSAPGTDAQAIAYTNGYAPLPGKGRWYVRHSGSSKLAFQVRFDGTPGDAASNPVTPATGNTPVANRAAGFTDQKTVAVPSTAEQLPDHAIPNGFSVVVTALDTNTRTVGIGFSAAAADLVTGTPKRLAPGASIRYFITNSNLLYVDAYVALEGVDITAEA